jgi:DNA repair protein RecN (Recombination protein N)
VLATLSVKNYAIIDNITIDFRTGMTVLTGETGAGKSLIIDAISLLLGERASSEIVRFGEDKAIIEGVFYYQNQAIDDLLDEFGLEHNENMLIIKREILATGKSVSRINGSIVTLNQILEISNRLADIHTQLDTKKLFDHKNYLSFIDNDDSMKLIESYKQALRSYRVHLREYHDLVNSKNKDIEQAEYIKFQIQELEKADLKQSEEEELLQEVKFLNNYESIHQHMSESVELLSEQNTINQLYLVKVSLEKLAKLNSKYETYARIVEDSYYQIDDLATTLSYDLNGLEFDPARLDEINGRLAFLSDLKRKHKRSIPELFQYIEELRSKVHVIDHYDEVIEDKKNEVMRCYQETRSIAVELSNHRKKLAKELETKIKDNLIDLQLPKTQFEIRFQPVTFVGPLDSSIFLSNGIDSINFYISLNIGEPLKELSKTASGGEMSRIMLALKTILSKNYGLSTMIFDEIDAGVSGNIAYSIANKLYEISQNTQVLCITHLPQVAAVSDQHIKISKVLSDGRTITKVAELSTDEKILEIASMISNDAVSNTSIALARELIKKK